MPNSAVIATKVPDHKPAYQANPNALLAHARERARMNGGPETLPALEPISPCSADPPQRVRSLQPQPQPPVSSVGQADQVRAGRNALLAQTRERARLDAEAARNAQKVQPAVRAGVPSLRPPVSSSARAVRADPSALLAPALERAQVNVGVAHNVQPAVWLGVGSSQLPARMGGGAANSLIPAAEAVVSSSRPSNLVQGRDYSSFSALPDSTRAFGAFPSSRNALGAYPRNANRDGPHSAELPPAPPSNRNRSFPSNRRPLNSTDYSMQQSTLSSLDRSSAGSGTRSLYSAPYQPPSYHSAADTPKRSTSPDGSVKPWYHISRAVAEPPGLSRKWETTHQPERHRDADSVSSAAGTSKTEPPAYSATPHRSNHSVNDADSVLSIPRSTSSSYPLSVEVSPNACSNEESPISSRLSPSSAVDGDVDGLRHFGQRALQRRQSFIEAGGKAHGRRSKGSSHNSSRRSSRRASRTGHESDSVELTDAEVQQVSAAMANRVGGVTRPDCGSKANSPQSDNLFAAAAEVVSAFTTKAANDVLNVAASALTSKASDAKLTQTPLLAHEKEGKQVVPADQKVGKWYNEPHHHLPKAAADGLWDLWREHHHPESAHGHHHGGHGHHHGKQHSPHDSSVQQGATRQSDADSVHSLPKSVVSASSTHSKHHGHKHSHGKGHSPHNSSDAKADNRINTGSSSTSWYSSNKRTSASNRESDSRQRSAADEACDLEVRNAIVPGIKTTELPTGKQPRFKPQTFVEFSDVDYLAVLGLSYWF